MISDRKEFSGACPEMRTPFSLEQRRNIWSRLMEDQAGREFLTKYFSGFCGVMKNHSQRGSQPYSKPVEARMSIGPEK
jgi:hypothetical protein